MINLTRRQTEFIKPCGFYKSSHLGRSVNNMRIEIKRKNPKYPFIIEVEESKATDIEALIKDLNTPIEPTFKLAQEVVHLHKTNAIKKYYLGEKPLKKESIRDIFMHASRVGKAHTMCFGLEAKTSAFKKVTLIKERN